MSTGVHAAVATRRVRHIVLLLNGQSIHVRTDGHGWTVAKPPNGNDASFGDARGHFIAVSRQLTRDQSTRFGFFEGQFRVLVDPLTQLLYVGIERAVKGEHRISHVPPVACRIHPWKIQSESP